MAQHDYVIANGTGAAVRSDLNDALAAIVSQNSGTTEPATTYAYQWWADTTTGLLKLRNGANNAWITLRQLDGDFTTVSVDNGSNSAPSIYFNASGTDTGIYSSGTDAVDITTAGTRRFGIASGGDVTVYGGNLTLNTQGDLRFADSDSSNWVAFQSPATVASNVTWTLPAADGTTGQVLSTDGSGTLSWATASATVDKIVEGNTEAEVVDTGSDGHFKVTTEGSERLRVDPSGRLLVGTSTARGTASNASTATVQIETANNTAAVQIVANPTSAFGPTLSFGKSRGNTLGSTTIVENNDVLGAIFFSGADGTDLNTIGAAIEARVDGTPGANDLPTRLVFSTTADSASSPTERMRIDSSGRVGIGTTSPGALLEIRSPDQNPSIFRLYNAYNAAGSSWGIDFYRDSNSGTNLATAEIKAVREGGEVTSLKFGTSSTSGTVTERMRIKADGTTNIFGPTDTFWVATSATGTSDAIFVGSNGASGINGGSVKIKIYSDGDIENVNNSYGALSDSKLKENIVDATSQWGDLKALQVRKYNLKADTGHNTHTQIGLIAQEVELVSPGLVSESPDRDEDGNDLGTVTKSVNYSVLYMKAVKALQEAMERIETLEAKVAALEAA